MLDYPDELDRPVYTENSDRRGRNSFCDTLDWLWCANTIGCAVHKVLVSLIAISKRRSVSSVFSVSSVVNQANSPSQGLQDTPISKMSATLPDQSQSWLADEFLPMKLLAPA